MPPTEFTRPRQPASQRDPTRKHLKVMRPKDASFLRIFEPGWSSDATRMKGMGRKFKETPLDKPKIRG
ncbi:MAG TPA: hypothetical protein DCK78_23315 [Paenibacillus lactis]|nr:hypothetical protein [Paenibacillus lactis]